MLASPHLRASFRPLQIPNASRLRLHAGLTFTIVGGSTLFEIIGNELRVKAGATFAFGTNPSITVRVTDSTANTFDESITIIVGDEITDDDTGHTINGTDGDDVIHALGGIDTVNGGLGDDTIDGGLGDDIIHGDDGNDVLDGNFGADTLNGDAGNDTLTGGSGGDTLNGGSGDDTLIADDGASGPANTLNGGADNDTLDNSNSHSAATLDGGTGNDTIHASIFAGVVDTITGGDGNDTITNVGLNSSDTVNAGIGNDTVEFYGLNASGFNSTITLGTGQDTVGFGHDPDLTVSYATITDFATGAGGDKIDLDRILNKLTGYTGDNPFTSGFLRLVQFDSDTTLLQVDGDGTANGGTFTTLFTLDNTTASAFTSANFTPSGFTPYVNVAPTLTAPSSVGATEQTTFDLKTAGFSVDDGSVTENDIVSLTLTITEGSLTVSPIALGATVTTVTDPLDPTIITSVTITGTVTQVNALLANNGMGALGYINDSDNPPSSTTLSVVLSDGGNTDTDSVTINIAPVNDAPVLDNLGSALFTEGGAAVAIVPSATVTDLDSPDFNGGSLTVGFAVVDGNGTPSDQLTIGTGGGIAVSGSDVTFGANVIGTFSGGANGSDLVVSFNSFATPAATQALVQHILFSNTSDNPSTLVRTLQFQLTDGDTGTATSSATVNVEAVNDAPVLGGGGSSLPYTENDAATAIDATLTVSDVDSANLTGATVSITGGFASGDVLGFVTQNGISGSYNAGTGVMTLSGTASLANYEAALRSVTYSSTSDNPSVTPRTVSFQINDGSSANNLSNVVDSTVTVTSTNDAPVLDLNGAGAGTGATLNYGENDPATAVAPGTNVSDPDSTNFDGGTLIISFTANGTTDDQLTIGTGGGIAVSGSDVTFGANVIGTFSGGANGSDLVVNLDPDATPVAVQALVRHILFSNSSNTPSAAPRTLQFELTDGDGGTTSSNATINVGTANEAPIVSANGGTLAYTENDAAGVINSLLTVSDVDSVNLTHATVSITSGFAIGQDVLGFASQNGITASYNAATGVLTLTGAATVANYQAALRSVTYFNSSDDPSGTPRILSFQVEDGQSPSNVATSVVTVTPVADGGGGAADFSLGGTSVKEFRADGTVVGTLSPASAGATFTYELLDDAGGRFTIVGNQLRVANGLLLDKEQAGSHQVQIKATDLGGVVHTGAFTITVLNIDPEVVGGNTAANKLVGGAFADTFSGDGGADTLRGQGGNDKLFGGSGNDTLIGEGGNDILSGDVGADQLTGGLGRDMMTGGANRDVFDFNALGEMGKNSATRDVIKDFQHSIDDFDLSTIDAMSGPGNQKFSFIGTNAFTGVKGQLHWFQQNFVGTANDKTIVEGDVNGDGKADFQIEITGLKVLTKGDFIL